MELSKLRPWLNLLALILMLVVNGLANALPLNGQTTGEISKRFQVYFVPAGYVFSIWGLIYLALFGFVVFQLLPTQLQNPRLARIGYWFLLTCLANSAWIFLWHFEIFALTLMAMFMLLISLIVIYLRLDIGRARVTTTEILLVDIPFNIYLAWITVATIANVTSMLAFYNWDGWGITPQAWAVIMLFTGVVIAGLVAWKRTNLAYLLVILWAYSGIAIKHATDSLVSIAAWIASILVIFEMFIAWLRRKRSENSLPNPLK